MITARACRPVGRLSRRATRLAEREGYNLAARIREVDGS